MMVLHSIEKYGAARAPRTSCTPGRDVGTCEPRKIQSSRALYAAEAAFFRHFLRNLKTQNFIAGGVFIWMTKP